MWCLFSCPMALNLHQKRPSPVTSGWLFHRTIQRETAAPHSFWWAMVQQSYPRHPSFHRAIRHKIAVPSSVLVGDGARKLPPWGLYFFKFLAPFPHHPHFCDRVNHYDAMPRMVTCNAFDCTKKESTTPKGVASLTPHSPG